MNKQGTRQFLFVSERGMSLLLECFLGKIWGWLWMDRGWMDALRESNLGAYICSSSYCSDGDGNGIVS